MASLALFDLDNTLLDREAAFALWARGFMLANALPVDTWPIIELTDEDGYKPRELFFAEIRTKFGIATSTQTLLERYRVDTRQPRSSHCHPLAVIGGRHCLNAQRGLPGREALA